MYNQSLLPDIFPPLRGSKIAAKLSVKLLQEEHERANLTNAKNSEFVQE